MGKLIFGRSTQRSRYGTRSVRWFGAIAVVFLAACGSARPPASVTRPGGTIVGSVKVGRDYGDCSKLTTQGYIEGESVTVKNESGVVVGAGQLGAEHGGVECAFDYSVPVASAAFYTVTVGRGSATVARQDLEARHWRVDFEAG